MKEDKKRRRRDELGLADDGADLDDDDDDMEGTDDSAGSGSGSGPFDSDTGGSN